MDDPVTSALLALLRQAPGPQAAELEALREGDWTRLVYRAKVHRVAPLIYRRLVTDGLTSAVPASALEFLRDESRRNWLRNIRIFRALGEILDALNLKGIPVMLLKGVHLAEVYYPDRALRPMGDIDIMVKFADYDEAAATLLLLGYALPGVESPTDLHVRYPRHAAMTNAQRLTVELHRTFEPRERPTRIDLDPIWDRARPLTVDGRPALALAPEDLLLHLCAHMAAQDCFATGLIALSDIAQVIDTSNGAMNWDLFTQRAHEWGASHGAHLVFTLGTELIGIRIPVLARTALHVAKVPDGLVAIARAFTLRGPRSTVRKTTPLLQLAGHAPVWRKAALLFRAVFVSREALARQYGIRNLGPILYLWYLVRMGDLTVRYGSTIWRLLRPDASTRQEGTDIFDERQLRGWLEAV